MVHSTPSPSSKLHRPIGGRIAAQEVRLGRWPRGHDHLGRDDQAQSGNQATAPDGQPGEKKTIKETEPFVQILDPATGTATFLVEVINIIEKTVKAKAWAKLNKGPYDHDQHSKREEVLKAWNQYVPEHLLKRLHAYELMMAPYVIAHMKVGLKLSETGYRFATEERARIYLTNALEPAKEFNDRLNFEVPALALEAKEVNRRKEEGIFTVILGNPPYSKSQAIYQKMRCP